MKTSFESNLQVARALSGVMVRKRLILRHALRICLTLLGLLVAWGQVYAQEQETDVPDPCSGPSALLAILDRPTVSTSPCAVPLGQFLLEMGFQRSKPRDPVSGTMDTYPQAEVRIGLPGRNEFIIIPPSYNRQRMCCFEVRRSTDLGCPMKPNLTPRDTVTVFSANRKQACRMTFSN